MNSPLVIRKLFKKKKRIYCATYAVKQQQQYKSPVKEQHHHSKEPHTARHVMKALILFDERLPSSLFLYFFSLSL